MTYTPVLPMSGYAGWTLLKRTMTAQTTAFTKSPEIVRDVDYFRARIGTVKTADQLVGDRRLLKVALGAFGLDADIDNKAFIKKILSDGTLKTTALANRMADKRYAQFSAAFGFDLSQPATQVSDFADKIISAYKSRAFETAVGSQDDDLRLALNAQRELGTIAARSSSETVKWLTVMGNPPLRTVVQKALGVPASASALDLDKQLNIFTTKAESTFGDGGLSQFADTAKMESLIKKFLMRSQADALMSQTGGNAISLALLQYRRST